MSTFLRHSEATVPLSWPTRMMIALGAAKGLAFLHNAERPVIYRDFKTSNILLDSVSHAPQIENTEIYFFFPYPIFSVLSLRTI